MILSMSTTISHVHFIYKISKFKIFSGKNRGCGQCQLLINNLPTNKGRERKKGGPFFLYIYTFLHYKQFLVLVSESQSGFCSGKRRGTGGYKPGPRVCTTPVLLWGKASLAGAALLTNHPRGPHLNVIRPGHRPHVSFWPSGGPCQVNNVPFHTVIAQSADTPIRSQVNTLLFFSKTYLHTSAKMLSNHICIFHPSGNSNI